MNDLDSQTRRIGEADRKGSCVAVETGVTVPVPVVSRLLGHSNVRMTLRYAHLRDREIEAAAESIGQSIGAMMDL